MLFRASNKLLPPLMVTVPPGRAVTVACHTLSFMFETFDSVIDLLPRALLWNHCTNNVKL